MDDKFNQVEFALMRLQAFLDDQDSLIPKQQPLISEEYDINYIQRLAILEVGTWAQALVKSIIEHCYYLALGEHETKEVKIDGFSYKPHLQKHIEMALGAKCFRNIIENTEIHELEAKLNDLNSQRKPAAHEMSWAANIHWAPNRCLQEARVLRVHFQELYSAIDKSAQEVFK